MYIEEGILQHPLCAKILSFFPHAVQIPVTSYKDVFSRKGQHSSVQIKSRNLILAEKKDHFLYPGSVVCHDFDERWFYYCTNVLNCVYDCAYCWLKGMYDSANLVVFVNQEDFLEETAKMLEEHPVYLCLSYENDLVPLENITGFLHSWAEFTIQNPGLAIEIRTKCGNADIWKSLPACERIIPAFTLSPDPVILEMEKGSASLSQRIRAVKTAAENGFHPRLCLDPVFAIPDWENIYGAMIRDIMQEIDPADLRDISLGTFRLSNDYMKKMRKEYPHSASVQYPYVLQDGYYGYEKNKKRKIENTIRKQLEQYVPGEKIYMLENE